MSYTDNIIHVGLLGPAGSGKTTTAKLIAPPGVVDLNREFKVINDHFILANPIYDVVGIKRNIEGDDKQSRIMHQLHTTLYDLLGGYVEYDELVELVYDIYASDAGTNEDPKPRSFMQWFGDVCRSNYEDCFIDYLLRRVRSTYRDTQRDLIDSGFDDDFMMLAFVSDVRRVNEIEKIRAQPNSVLIRFEGSREVLNERILERDGKPMTEEQWNHPTEKEANELDPTIFDIVINTDGITPKQQALATIDFLQGYLGVELRNPVQSANTDLKEATNG